MNATLYTGNGYTTSGTQSITNGVAGASFQPDLIWIKSRSNSSASHTLTDVNRGLASQLFTNLSSAQETVTDAVTAFNSNGFSLGANATGVSPYVNVNGATFVAWQWKANGTPVSNTAGSITTSVSANTTAGFSVVGYTGNGSTGTIGHGLNAVPSMVIVKRRTGSPYDWYTYHVSLGNTQFIRLNTTGAVTSFNLWQNTTPTSSLFYLANDTGVNASATTFIAYCWAPIAGYSAFGSYTGNGSADGPFVYLGFKPSFIMIKRTDTAGTDWVIMDYQRLGYNVTDVALNPNANYAENSGYGTDFVSNGFKLRTTTSFLNASSGTYIYACFAQNPFKYANAR
jgi:hypothetical protein